MEAKRGELDYNARNDKKVCDRCGSEQSFDEWRGKKTNCAVCEVGRFIIRRVSRDKVGAGRPCFWLGRRGARARVCVCACVRVRACARAGGTYTQGTHHACTTTTTTAACYCSVAVDKQSHPTRHSRER